jgi:hypothetical protein
LEFATSIAFGEAGQNPTCHSRHITDRERLILARIDLKRLFACGRGEGVLITRHSHLGLARAVALTSDTAESRKAYEDFFAVWKEADVELPLLLVARKEVEGQ